MKRSVDEQGVIILGSGLGGLIAGTFLAKHNQPVLLLKERGYQPFHTINAYRFVPFSNFSEKRLKPSLLKKISQAFNLPSPVGSQEEGKATQHALERSMHRDTLQVVLPKARIDILSQRPLFQREWKREFPKEETRIEEFYSEFDRLQHLLKRAKAEKRASPFFPIQQYSLIKRFFSFDSFPKEKMGQKLGFFSKEFKEFIQLQLMSWGNLHPEHFATPLAAHILSDERDELVPNADLEKLEEGVSNQFLQRGGKVEEIDQVRGIEQKWRRGLTVSLEGDPRVFRSKFLIFNSPLHRISSLLSKKVREVLEKKSQIKIRNVLIPLFLGIHEKVIPVGMKDLVISILDLDKAYHGGNLLFLSLSPKGDETKAPEGRRALTVETFMDPAKWGQTLLADYQKGVMDHLRHLFPFLEEHIELVDFEWAREHVSKRSYSHFLYEAPSDFDWREGVVPLRMSKNIYLVGKENFPYLGLEGEIFSGLMVGEQILKKYS
jgi:phytoene dehydrogenase-like protein